MRSLSRSAARSVSKLSNKIRRRIDALSSTRELSGAQGRVLHFLLAQTEDVFQKDIEEEYGLRPPTASELLKKMEKNGLICRESMPQDARLKRIIVCDKALCYRQSVMDDLITLEEDLVRDISEQDLEVFFRVINQMTKNLS
ncbi:MarR family winged helix-turn-helix transcriptional regulator [uncultured Ruthenibacterium sp.]|uniref:MarR family winged helix-turn-helix transcriptional regulator n=1 Tax=uncultured Ruthenibacterium sp. TaxID=1905347 RepID=UPI00349EDE1C